MVDTLKKSLCIVLAWFLVVIPTAQAQQPTPTVAPVPPQILSAHVVFVSNGGGTNYFNAFTGGPNSPYNIFYADLEQTNRFQLASAPAQADVIFEIRGIAPAINNDDTTAGYNPQLILNIIDPKTSAVLWTTSANVRAGGTRKSRDKGLDQSVAVLVDKLSQVTGQPLNAAEIKAINKNSSVPTSFKVLLILGLIGVAAGTSYGLYRVSHQPKLSTPAAAIEP